MAPRLTHFLCIPLVNSSSRHQLERSLLKFRENVQRVGHSESDVANAPQNNEEGSSRRSHFGDVVLQEGAGEGVKLCAIPPTEIRPLGTLHLTLGVMSLLTSERVSDAIKLLQRLDLRAMIRDAELVAAAQEPQKSAATGPGKAAISTASATSTSSDAPATAIANKPSTSADTNGISASCPLSVSLRGLHPMHAPSATSVLYASPYDPSSILYSFCVALQKTFLKAGLLLSEERDLRLHATIMNTTYAKGATTTVREEGSAIGGKGRGGRSNQRQKLDVCGWIREYNDYVWADEVRLDKVAICLTGAKPVDGADGQAYEEVASVYF